MQINCIYTQVTHNIKKSQKQTHSYYRSWSQRTCLINICCIRMQLFGSPQKMSSAMRFPNICTYWFFMYLFVPPLKEFFVGKTHHQIHRWPLRHGSTAHPGRLVTWNPRGSTTPYGYDGYDRWNPCLGGRLFWPMEKYICYVNIQVNEKLHFILCILLFQ